MSASSSTFRLARRNPLAAAGVTLVVMFVAFAIFAPWIAPRSPSHIDLAGRLASASAEHWFGTDELGRDILSRLIFGARISLVVGSSVVSLSLLLGLIVGSIAGFYGGIADRIINIVVMNAFLSFPGILLAIALMAVTRGSVATVVIAITVPEIPRVVRLVRSLTLSLREQLFVEAAKAIGTRLPQTLWRHILPNVVAPLVVQATFVAASAVLIEAALSFLGVGIPSTTPSWGNMMAEGRNVIAVGFHIILYPGMLLAATVLAINLMGDGLRDALDPRLARQL